MDILLYHHDTYFVSHFRTFLSEKAKGINVFFFSEEESAKQYYQHNHGKAMCILSDSDFLKDLADGDCLKILLSDETKIELDGEALCGLNIYQHRDAILDDLHRILQAQGMMSAKKTNRAPIIAFFSTQGGSGKTTMAYLTAIKGAETKKTVYINLEGAPSIQTLYQHKSMNKAEEIFCTLKDQVQKSLLAALERNEHGVYILPVPDSMIDQANLEKGDIEYLLDTLQNYADVGYIVVDLGTAMNAVAVTVFEQADRVILIYSDDRMGHSKKAYLEHDPNYKNYAFCGKEVYLLNRCRQQYQDGAYQLYMPVSKSVAVESDLRIVLQGNGSLQEGCQAILTF